MKKYFLLFLSVFFLYSCSDEIPEEQLPVRAGRTVLAYLISNNGGGNLDSNLKQNLVDMYAGLASVKDTCSLVVYYRPYSSDNDGLEGPSILKFTSDGDGNINKKAALEGSELTPEKVIMNAEFLRYAGEENATDHETMKRMLEEMKELSPSESYGLIFGSHGTGWLKGNEYKAGRSFGDDAGFNIDIPDMARTLKSVFSEQPLDFILFDACMMCTAEVCYELREVTNYLVGSVVETHVIGNPYDVIMPKLFKEEIEYADICKDYINYSKKLDAWGVSAAIDCSKMEELASWVKDNIGNYSGELSELDLGDVQQYGVYRTSRTSNYKYFSFDIVDLFTVLNDNEVPSGLEKIMNEVVVAKDALYGSQYPVVGGQLLIEEGHYCGIGMYLPENPQINRTEWDEYYKESIAWYNAVGWNGFNYQQQNQ